jgi:HD-GYP domain-containing protein (c-di-GMP phosphodiesterase class II)
MLPEENMPNTTDTLSALETIAITELKVGMYVVNILIPQKKAQIKSEGYVFKTSTIDKLTKMGVNQVNIDPSKDKSKKKISEKIDSISLTEKKKIKNQKKQAIVPLDQEIKKANKLYNRAKSLQKRILANIKSGKGIDINIIEATTNDMVESLFRNEDALSCMSRLRDKDNYLAEHSLNSSILMTIFAKHLDMDYRKIQELALGAFLHDIGMTFLSDTLLKKTSKFTKNEAEERKTHVSLGLKLLEDTPSVSHMAMTLLLEHHERLDGSGYPNQLKGNAISKYGRMMAIVDSYDAMTGERPFQVTEFAIDALNILAAESPEKYDADLVKVFTGAISSYPVGTLVQLASKKLGIISQLNKGEPLKPYVRVFYNTKSKHAIAVEEINLSKPVYKDSIEKCVKPGEFNIDILRFFKNVFLD